MNNEIKFEKPPKSYWIDSTNLLDYPKLQEDITVDLAIIGGGIVGISSAYLLQEHGLKIAVLEGNRILRGVTGHTTAKITSQHGLIYDKIKTQLGDELAKQYADANETAINRIKKIAMENQIHCEYTSQPAYIYTEKSSYIKDIQNEVKAANSLGIKASYLEDIPLPISIKAALRFDNQAQFHPLKYLSGLAKIISNKGVKIYENTRAIALDDEEDSYIITTEQGKKVKAKQVIIASHYPFYNKHGMYYSRIYAERAYVVAIKSQEKFLGGMYINAEEPTRSIRHQPTADGELILVVGENHKTGQGDDTNVHYERLIDFANNIFTVEDIPYRWSTQDCMTLDGLPYVGHYTKNTPNLYIATGFGKWGMTNGMASAMILKDLILTGESQWQDVYNPSRKTIISSAKNFLVENINVAGQLIGGKLSGLSKYEDVSPGESIVMDLDGERVGVYRNSKGELYMVDTTCTHMGCELNWNSAELSWDCPCHGSRFTYKGEIIQGPATKPLRFGNDVETMTKLLKEDF